MRSGIRNSIGGLLAMACLSLMSVMGAQAGTVQASGGVLQDDNTYAAVYVNAKDTQGVSGQISVTTGSEHLWGFVDRVEYISPTFARVYALDYARFVYEGVLEELEVDVDTSAPVPRVSLVFPSLQVSARRLIGRAVIRQ